MIKDSGERKVFKSGACRDISDGKGDMYSMPAAAILRVSRHYEEGAKKYTRHNYQKGIPVSSFMDSALRHIFKYLDGMDDEDHLSAAAFNILGAIQMEERNPDMCDVDSRNGKRRFHYQEEKVDCTGKKVENTSSEFKIDIEKFSEPDPMLTDIQWMKICEAREREEAHKAVDKMVYEPDGSGD